MRDGTLIEPLGILRADLRTDHAGETGAVFIYRGILAINRDPAVRRFATEHQATEQSHLRMIEEVLPRQDRSWLLPLWRVAGWLTGAIPALCGSRAVYATIDAVETFVDRHYQDQLDKIAGKPGYDHLRDLITVCQADEVRHRDEARVATGSAPGPVLRIWTLLVAFGSETAVKISRRV